MCFGRAWFEVVCIMVSVSFYPTSLGCYRRIVSIYELPGGVWRWLAVRIDITQFWGKDASLSKAIPLTPPSVFLPLETDNEPSVVQEGADQQCQLVVPCHAINVSQQLPAIHGVVYSSDN